MKKLLTILGLGISLTLGMGACSSYQPIRVVPGAGATYNMPYKQGEKYMHRLAKTAEKEDGLMYINGAWYDIGFDEKETEVCFDLEKVISLIEKKGSESEEAICTHIHPKTVIQQDPKDVYPPSPADIDTHARIKKMLKEEQISINFISRVYDGHGVWEYDVTKKLEFMLNSREQNPHGSYRPLRMIFELEMNDIRKEILENKSLTRKEKIKKYIEAAKEIGILLKYAPIKEAEREP